jgi:hypothetical protein
VSSSNGPDAVSINNRHPGKAQDLVEQGKFDLSHRGKKNAAWAILAVLRQKNVGQLWAERHLCPQAIETAAIYVRAGSPLFGLARLAFATWRRRQ